MRAEDGNTRWGFKWGYVKVQRLTEHRGNRILGVDTPHRRLEICVSPTGRSVRVWLDGRLLK